MKQIRNLPKTGQPALSRLCLSIAGLGAVIESDEPGLDIEPQGAMRRFLVDAVEPDLTVRTHWATLATVCVLGFGLRAAYLAQPIRYDEAATYLAFASRPVWLAVADYSYPNNHIFHTLLVKLSVVNTEDLIELGACPVHLRRVQVINDDGEGKLPEIVPFELDLLDGFPEFANLGLFRIIG